MKNYRIIYLFKTLLHKHCEIGGLNAAELVRFIYRISSKSYSVVKLLGLEGEVCLPMDVS